MPTDTTLTVRRAEDRGQTRIDWLDSRHSFSFGQYHDPRHMGFRSLRVINDDRVAPGGGFGEHGHRDMEILTWVLDGGLAHRDSLGHGATLQPGELQVMTAGTGIRHSEFNASGTDPVHFLQIWILPERQGLSPRYEQKAFPLEERRNTLRLVASRDGRDGSLQIHQDADLHVADLEAGADVTFDLRPDRHAWIHVARGEVEVAGEVLREGDGAAISTPGPIRLHARNASEVLLFDLA